MANKFRNWFGNQDKELPESLRDKTPDEVAASLKEFDEVKAKLASIEANRANEKTEMDQLKTSYSQTQTRIQELEAAARRPAPAPQPPAENPDFVTDPDGAFNSRVAPLASITVQTAAQTARIIAKQQLDARDLTTGTRDGRLFDHWSAEITEASKRYQATQMVSPEAWVGIYMWVKGNHADELADPEARKKKFSFLEPAASAVVTRDESSKTPADQLTDQEKHVADKMGVSYENYLKRKKSMTFVNA